MSLKVMQNKKENFTSKDTIKTERYFSPEDIGLTNYSGNLKKENMAFVDDSLEDDFGNFKSMSGVSVTKKKTRSKNNDKMQLNASGVDESEVQKLEERLTALVEAETQAKKQEQADAEAKRQRDLAAKKELVDSTIIELGKVVAILDRIKKVRTEVTPFTTSAVASVKAEAIIIYNSASDLVARCMNMQGELLEVVRSLDPNHYVLTAKL